MNKKALIIFSLLSGLSACSQIDNYVLGKDNTEKPHELTSIKSKASLHVDWSIPIGNVRHDQTLKLKPLIRGMKLYTADSNGLVQAFSKKTGKLLWTAKLKDSLLSGPIQGEGVLAFGTSLPGLIVLRETDGQVMWRTEVSSDVLATPAIAHNYLIAKTIDGRLYAFDLRTGEKKWVVDHGSPHLILKASSSPKVIDDKIVVGFADGTMEVIDLHSGRSLWQRSLAYARGSSDVERLVDIDSDPILRNDVIYLASYQGYVAAMALNDGRLLWNKPASVYKNMALDAHNIYVTDSHDVLLSMDLDTGLVKWKQKGLKYRELTAPVIMDKFLIVGDHMGYVHVIDVKSGMLIARTMLSGSIEGAPVVSGNRVYIMTSKGQLSAVTVTSL